MTAAGQDDIRPDLIRGDHHIVFSEEFHDLFQFSALPDTATWIVGGAEDGRMDIFFRKLSFHILKIHSPAARVVLYKRAQHDVIPVIFQGFGEPDVSRGVQQNLVAFGTKYIQGAEHTAEYAVFIADALLRQPLYAVACFLPSDDGIIIFVPG